MLLQKVEGLLSSRFESAVDQSGSNQANYINDSGRYAEDERSRIYFGLWLWGRSLSLLLLLLLLLLLGLQLFFLFLFLLLLLLFLLLTCLFPLFLGLCFSFVCFF